MNSKVKAILSGLATYVPGYRYMKQTGGLRLPGTVILYGCGTFVWLMPAAY